jgi:hypothetical protein
MKDITNTKTKTDKKIFAKLLKMFNQTMQYK